MSTFEDDFNAFLDTTDQDLIKARPSRNLQKFPCGQCAGTGTYRGARVHQEKAHCFACRGLGYFKTDPRKLEARRVAKATAKADAKETLLGAMEENHPDLFRELALVHREGSRSEFIASLATQLFERGTLTENQINAWYRGRARYEEVKAAREAEEKAQRVEVDLTPIRAMFETAVGNGYKKPTYRAEGLVINRAPDTGNNPGALYVKDEADTYLGKILGTTFHPTRDGRPAGALLVAIAQDPLGAVLRYGQRTGNCSCCGRKLTNHTSIDEGIGPICKQKWGL